MGHVHPTRIRVSEGGRIVIPAAVRECLHMDVGAELILTVEGDHATLMNVRAARQRARDRVRRYIPPEVDLVKELMAERKAEAKHE